MIVSVWTTTITQTIHLAGLATHDSLDRCQAFPPSTTLPTVQVGEGLVMGLYN